MKGDINKGLIIDYLEINNMILVLILTVSDSLCMKT